MRGARAQAAPAIWRRRLNAPCICASASLAQARLWTTGTQVRHLGQAWLDLALMALGPACMARLPVHPGPGRSAC